MAGNLYEKNNARSLLFAVFALLASASLAREESSPTMSVDGWPDWLVESMATENPALEAMPVHIADRNISTNLIGKVLSEPQDIEIGWYLTSDIGSDTPMECWIFTSAVDPSTTVNNIVNINMDATSKLHGAIGDQFVYYVDAGAIGDHPYLAYEKMYLVGEAPNALIGFVKVRIANRDGVQFACSHNLAGYRETFARGFEQFVLDATIDPEGNPPFLREILRNSIGEQTIGYMEISYAVDENGNSLISRQSATLMPLDSSTVMTEDSFDIGHWSPNGDLISRTVAASSNGELTLDLDLVANEDGSYSVSGTMQGKSIEYEITDPEPPKSDLFQILETQRLIADPNRHSITVNVWEPSADPTKFIPATLQLDPDGRDDLLATVTTGPISMKVQLDENGSLRNATIPIGAAIMHIERIRAIGEYPRLEDDD